MVMSREQDAERSHSVKTENGSFESVEEIKYLGKNLTNDNFIQEEIKSRMKSGNDWYHSAENLLSSSLLRKSIKTKIYRTIIFPFVLYGCETWSFTLREERRLKVFENKVPRRLFGPNRTEVQRSGENYKMRGIMNFIPYPILFG